MTNSQQGEVGRPALWWMAVVLLYVLVCLIWGTTWLGIKVAVTDMPPTTAAGLRFLVAAPVLIGLCLSMRLPLLFPRRLLGFSIFVTAGYFFLPYLLINIGEQYISSGLAAICFSTVSVLIVLFSAPILGTPLKLSQLAGIVVAVVALIALVLSVQQVSFRNPWGVIAVLCAATMHAFAYAWIKKLGREVHVLTLNTLPMAIGGALLLLLGVITDPPSAASFTTSSVTATIYLGLIASALGFLAYFWLLQRLSAVTMSFIFVIFPVIAQLFGIVIEGTPFSPVDLLLTLVIVAAFAWTQLSARGKPAAAKPAEEELPSVGLPTAEQLAEIYASATRTYPRECCGYVRRSGVRECFNAIDELRSGGASEYERTARTGYAFASGDLLKIARSFDSDDPVVLIFHSHPDVGSYFSAEDQRHAVIDGRPVYPVDHLVVDASQDGVRGARKFRFSEQQARYVECGVYGAPTSQRSTVADLGVRS